MTAAKPTANVVFLGGEGSGKSTTIGHLLHLLQPNPRQLSQIEKETAEKGVPACKFAWIVSRSPQERAQGHTINVSYHLLETESVSFTLFDVPGRRKWTGNMYAGTSCADIAVLVVSAARGQFEVEAGHLGPCREHLLLAFTAGVKQLIVLINQMDTCSALWAADRYEEITTELTSYAKRVGYNVNNVSFVPISAWHGWNLTQLFGDWAWYSGVTLLQALVKLQPQKRALDRPVRVSVLEVVRIGGIGTVAVGKVQTGSCAPGSNIAIAPSGLVSTGNSIERHYVALEKAEAGALAGFHLRNVSRRDLKRGYVLSSAPVPACVRFTAQVIVLFHPRQVRPGYQAVLHCHTAKTPCQIAVFLAKIDRRTGRTVEERPAAVQTGDALLCVLQAEKAICVERFVEFPPLGRFALREMGVTVAVGVIKEVESN